MFLRAVDDVVEDADEVGPGNAGGQSVHLELVEARQRRSDKVAKGRSKTAHQGEFVTLLFTFIRQELRRDADRIGGADDDLHLVTGTKG